MLCLQGPKLTVTPANVDWIENIIAYKYFVQYLLIKIKYHLLFIT